jgi:hypothetical protein
MIKQKILVFVFVASLIAITGMRPEKSSSGAPASHTGAPAEQTCATIGCHDDNSINSGSANLSIDMGSVTAYVPNQTYTIKVKITDPSVERFGFQLVALQNSDSSNIGSFQITDKYRTQLTHNSYQLSDRQYVTYTFDGTDAVSTGKGEWEMNWTAPSANVGEIIFYAAAVSANDDGIDKGDYVYTTTKSINAK